MAASGDDECADGRASEYIDRSRIADGRTGVEVQQRMDWRLPRAEAVVRPRADSRTLGTVVERAVVVKLMAATVIGCECFPPRCSYSCVRDQRH